MAELSRPAWLDDDFLKTCIKNSRNLTPSGTNNIKIESVVLDYAVPRGENFLSVLYRVHVKYCLGVITLKYTESFIVKVSHEEKNLLDLTRTLFDREIDMYTKVIPAMHVIMDDTRFACRSLCAIINSEPLVLVLEDLSPEGYGLGDRCKGLDLKHYKLALKKLAKYHASSKIFYDTLDDASKAKISAQPIKDNGDENGRETQRKFKERSLKKAAQIIEELSTYADKYATSIKFFESYLAYPRDYTSNICPAIPGNVFDTISHSDFWVNNIMFKYSEDGSPEECVFVDLQMSHLTSVSQDFLYFFVTSSDPNVKLQFAELKQYYFEKFLVNLKNLGFKGKMPTMNDFQKELQRGSLIVISALTNALPIILGKRLNEQHPDETSLDDLISSMDKNDGIYNDTMTAAVEALQDNRILDKYPRFSDLGDIDCSNGVWISTAMMYPSNEPLPQWLRDDFLKTCIRNSQNFPKEHNAEILNVSISYLVPKGENFMSTLYRTKIEFRSTGANANEAKEISLVIKAEHDAIPTISSQAFDIEIKMYRDIIPTFINLLGNSGLKTRFFCRYIHSDMVEQRRILVLEDLNHAGYMVTDKTKGFDLEHCKLVFEKLAQMHAASLYLCQEKEQCFSKDFKRSPWFGYDDDENYALSIKASTKKKIDDILVALGKYPTKYETAIRYYKKHEDMLGDIKIFTDMISYEDGNQLNALIHGDCWSNNVMFKYGPDSKPDDVVFNSITMVNLTSEPRPEWLSDDLLKTCIRNSQKLPTNTDLYLDEIFVTYVVPKGENYMSVMYRVKVPYRAGFRSNKVEELTVIMKVEHGNFSDVTPFAFERETEMYRDIIPQWHDKLEKKKMDTKFICRYIHYVKVEDSSILVLEDIKLLEYEVADRTKGLDRNHCKFLLRKLAKMHAASMTYCHDQNIGISNAYRKSPFFAFDENETSAANIKTNAKKKIAGILEILGKYPTKYQRAIKFFEEIEDSFVTRKNFTDMLPYKEGNKFNTIIHGDCWINNIMFKYAADSSLEDVLFVDFQASYYTSIAYDFMYFMFSSVSLEVRRSHFGELKNFYFNSLAKDLKALEYGGEMPTLEDYDKELQRAIRVAIFSLMTLLPICLAKLDSQSLSREDSDALSLDEISSIMGTVSDETLWTKLVLASSDIIIKEKLIDAFVA